MTNSSGIAESISPISIPLLESYLPDLIEFTTVLANDAASKKLTSWGQTADRVRAFFTPSRMQQFDSLIPGWQHMASYSNNLTLIHVMLVFAGLWHNPEYLNLKTQQQTMMQWIVLFHDLGKRIVLGRGDSIHGFRSAVLTAQQLSGLGFAKTANFESHIQDWCTLTSNAIITRVGRQPIQDNRQLPAILVGIDQLFGHNSPASLIVKTVLLHMSITILRAWPQSALLSQEEIGQYIDKDLFPLLKTMMLIDNAAWAFFNPLDRKDSRAEALAVFERIERVIS